jgi:DNA-directed RNA polymerase specialized sigma24 family protein
VTFEQFAIARLDRLLGMASAICGDRSLAQDLVQNVLIKVQLHWPRIDGLQDRDAYVRRMLVNEYLSLRRTWARAAAGRRA